MMVLDGHPANRSKWKELGGNLWMGDISRTPKGRRVQDVSFLSAASGRLAVSK
jgi:hypothetical protein